jgi:hypothetical protein
MLTTALEHELKLYFTTPLSQQPQRGIGAVCSA